MKQVSIRLPDEINHRLDSLAESTGRSKTYYLKEAVLTHIEDLEDIYTALERLKHPGKTYTQEEVEKYLGLDD